MSEDKKLKVIYGGPPQQVCYALAEHGYSPTLIHDHVYELPAELARALVRSSNHFVFPTDAPQGDPPKK